MAHVPKFQPEDRVFVKMRGYPAWPAKIENVEVETVNKVNRTKYHVFFYGTNQVGVCKEEEIYPFAENLEMLGKPKKAKGFNEGMRMIEMELGLVKDRPTPVVNPEDNNLDEIGLHTLDESKTMLKVQSILTNIEIGIQSSLTLKKADPDSCLKYLKELSLLKLNPLVLKKHPGIIDTLYKLKGYVGNTSSWNMTPEEKNIFLKKAACIRHHAFFIIEKFKSMFGNSEEEEFMDYFKEEVKTFEATTNNMTLEDICYLTTDPSKRVE